MKKEHNYKGILKDDGHVTNNIMPIYLKTLVKWKHSYSYHNEFRKKLKIIHTLPIVFPPLPPTIKHNLILSFKTAFKDHDFRRPKLHGL